MTPQRVRLSFASCVPADPVEHEGTMVLSVDEPPPKEVVVILEVNEPGWGFGEFTLIQNEDGVFLDTEMTNMEKVKAAFCALLDSAIKDTDTDPERHRLYNKARVAYCGPACDVCNPKEK